ncbi:uncharacterized protein LOC141673876 [Apium graveolens]|uniref:uncharacterized protein LOC141673876 n=1 Tax=Apium graveolens TaxID=4045 RepID=UPI003D79E26A
MVNEIEEDGTDNELDLVQFPLHSEESLLDLIIVECGKLQVNFEGEGKNSITTSIMPTGSRIIEEHWSHKSHPLEQIQYTSSESGENDNNDYGHGGVLTCDGCIQQITVSHPSYYACVKCDFFLHSFCATKLPQKLHLGASPFHPQHTLLLRRTDNLFVNVRCKVCGYQTNGFYYHCETCDIVIDIRCVFVPTRIKHRSHKHSLVQGPSSNSMCSVSNTRIARGMEYGCETCSSFKISMLCAFYPSRMKHRYDDHPLTLRQPPFFYEGVFYCEICEEHVNNQVWLYHCGESCDHSFHYDCLRWHESIKLERNFKIRRNDILHKYRVLKRSFRKNYSLMSSKYQEQMNEWGYLIGCDGCGQIICRTWCKEESF